MYICIYRFLSFLFMHTCAANSGARCANGASASRACVKSFADGSRGEDPLL